MKRVCLTTSWATPARGRYPATPTTPRRLQMSHWISSLEQVQYSVNPVTMSGERACVSIAAPQSEVCCVILSLREIRRLVSVDLRVHWKHAARDWRDSHHAIGCLLSRWLLQRREHSILFGLVYLYSPLFTHGLFFFFNLFGLFLLAWGLADGIILFVAFESEAFFPFCCLSFSVCLFASLHSHSRNPGTDVWVHAWLLPH